MSLQITIQPSGRILHTDQGETVLTAAIDAGVNLPYGCRNGTCGACKGKVISGEVTYQQATPALTENEKAAGMALFCCAMPESDLVIECREIEGNGMVRPRILPVRVQSLVKASHDVMVMTLKLPSNEKLQFMAGQYIEFLLKDGKRRAFSLANAPHREGEIELHLRLIPGGTFTEFVFNEMQEKAILRIEAPFGSFYLREETQKSIVFVAGGTGFAPIKGIIEHMIAKDIEREVILYWGARAKEDLYMTELAEQWAEQHAHIRYIPVLSDAKPEDAWTGRTGLVHQAVLDDIQDLAPYEVYCCGAPAMVDIAYASFQEQGLPQDAFFYDAFTFSNPVPKP